jgi:hypothetical protein
MLGFNRFAKTEIVVSLLQSVKVDRFVVLIEMVDSRLALV